MWFEDAPPAGYVEHILAFGASRPGGTPDPRKEKATLLVIYVPAGVNPDDYTLHQLIGLGAFGYHWVSHPQPLPPENPAHRGQGHEAEVRGRKAFIGDATGPGDVPLRRVTIRSEHGLDGTSYWTYVANRDHQNEPQTLSTIEGFEEIN
ncbi:MAG TPA: hypothetical protein VNE62_07070 [Actinomycetota bacterium]|nr:hypothetical protein [Actinomycetota bacterium]